MYNFWTRYSTFLLFFFSLYFSEKMDEWTFSQLSSFPVIPCFTFIINQVSEYATDAHQSKQAWVPRTSWMVPAVSLAACQLAISLSTFNSVLILRMCLSLRVHVGVPPCIALCVNVSAFSYRVYALLCDPCSVCELFWRSVCSNGKENDSSHHLFHQTVREIKGNKPKRQGTFALAWSLKAARNMTSPFSCPQKKKKSSIHTHAHKVIHW